MFWRKKEGEQKDKQKKKKSVQKIEGAMWGYMVSKHGVIVDVLQNLRQVERHGVIEGKPAIMVRIFDPAAVDEKGVAIEDYESLGDNPELVLYEGYCRETGGRLDIHIEKK
ncbi:hypothetical protein ACFLV4_06420 [Chloroflexota bacterium]